MTAKEIMLSAIRAQLCGAQSLPYACLSEDMTAQIYALTKEHDMAHLVAAEFDKQGLLSNNQEISEKFRKQYMGLRE